MVDVYRNVFVWVYSVDVGYGWYVIYCVEIVVEWFIHDILINFFNLE